MEDAIDLQGRTLTPADLDTIRDLILSHPGWNRTRLSRELCALWDWRTPSGQVKDMACRTMLLKLHRRGLIQLPARQRPSVNHRNHDIQTPVKSIYVYPLHRAFRRELTREHQGVPQ